MNKQIQWFTENELPRLKKAGIINDETCERIREFYHTEAASENSGRVKMAVTLLAVLGGLLFSCGIILLLAYNWDMFPGMARVSLAMAPLVLAAIFGCWGIHTRRGPAVCEPAALFTAASAATALAVISQIYNVDGTLPAYLLTLLTITLPLTWIFQSTSLAMVQAFCITSQINSDSSVGKWLLTAVIFGCLLWFLFRRLRNAGKWHGGLLRVTIGWLLMLMPFANLLDTYEYQPCHELIFAVSSTLVFILGLALHFCNREAAIRQKNPWLPCGFLLWIICFFVARYSRTFSLDIFPLSNLVIPLAFLAATIVICLRMKQAIFWVIALTIPILLFTTMINFAPVRAIICIAFWAAAGIVLLCRGLKSRDTVLGLAGISVLFVIAINHFVTSTYGILLRATGMMTGGIAVTLAAIMITRHCHRQTLGEGGEK